MHDFIPNGVSDPKGAIIHTGIVAVAGVKLSILWFFYDGPEPPTTGPWAEFVDVPAIISTTKTQSYSSLVRHTLASHLLKYNDMLIGSS